jgi:hypothetical protein
MTDSELSEEAGLDQDVYTWNQIQLERFAELIRQDETKACAKYYFEIMRDAVEAARFEEREACANLYIDENGTTCSKAQPEQESFNRLIRIMGTFDLATGHADNWDDLLDSLESELHDVLGHYREALKQDHGFDRTASHMAGEYVSTNQQNVNTFEERVQKSIHEMPDFLTIAEELAYCAGWYKSIEVNRKEYVGLTDEEIYEVANGKGLRWSENYHANFAHAIEAKLREKNE